MGQMRKAKDPKWKERVKAGLNPDGRPLTNLRELNRNEWEEQVQTAFPDLEEKQKEVVGRVRAGEYSNVLTEVSHD